MKAIPTYEAMGILRRILFGDAKIYQRDYLNEKEIKALNTSLSGALSPLAKYYPQPTTHED